MGATEGCAPATSGLTSAAVLVVAMDAAAGLPAIEGDGEFSAGRPEAK